MVVFVMLLRTPLLRAPAALLLPALRPLANRYKFPLAARPLLGAVAEARSMGTRGRHEPKEPLHSPKGAKEFIYRLKPAERSCLLQELQGFESMAAAQGKTAAQGGREGGQGPDPGGSRLTPPPSTTPCEMIHR